MNQLIADLAGLLESANSPTEFFEPFLSHGIELTGGVGAAAWERDSSGRFQLVHANNLDVLGLDDIASGWIGHALLLEDACRRTRTMWVPPHEETNETRVAVNLSPMALILAPILIEKKVVGFLEIIQSQNQDREKKKTLVRSATELAGFAAAYFHKRQWRQAQNNQRLAEQLEVFSAKVHRSLDPKEVAYHVANDGKVLLACDQLSVGLRCGGRFRVSAVSGAVDVAERSPLIRAMGALFDRVANAGQTVVYDGSKDESLPPEVYQTLDDYLALSNSKVLVVAPSIDYRAESRNRASSLLMAECFDANTDAAQIQQRLDTLNRHCAPAIHNALEFERLPLKWLSRGLAQLRDGIQGRALLKGVACLIVLFAIAAVLILIEVPLRTEAVGHLVPKERRIVYSSMNGKILQMAVGPNELVEEGQELLFIEDLETKLDVDRLSVKIGSLAQKLTFLDEQLNGAVNTAKKAEYLSERIKTEYELGKAKVERNLLFAVSRSPEKSAVTAPLTGRILTFDANRKLLGKSVKAGEPLLRIATVSDAWEVELLIPERQVGIIREALHRADGNVIDVELLLTSHPHCTYRGRMSLHHLGGETVVQNDRIVLPARVEIADRSLLTQLKKMPVGVEVRARINCGWASSGHVWFGPLWNAIYERFIF